MMFVKNIKEVSANGQCAAEVNATTAPNYHWMKKMGDLLEYQIETNKREKRYFNDFKYGMENYLWISDETVEITLLASTVIMVPLFVLLIEHRGIALIRMLLGYIRGLWSREHFNLIESCIMIWSLYNNTTLPTLFRYILCLFTIVKSEFFDWVRRAHFH